MCCEYFKQELILALHLRLIYTDDDWEPGMPVPEPKAKGASAVSLWEYKWGESSDEIFGPYRSDQLLEWKETVRLNDFDSSLPTVVLLT
jgi:hypothetical protein